MPKLHTIWSLRDKDLYIHEKVYEFLRSSWPHRKLYPAHPDYFESWYAWLKRFGIEVLKD